jgi:glycosyltransferase involved in cell wall biosynthesis
MGPDVITQAKNGYLVPIRDVEALVSSISALQKLTEPEYLQFRKEAREAALRFTWDRFRMELADLIRDF